MFRISSSIFLSKSIGLVTKVGNVGGVITLEVVGILAVLVGLSDGDVKFILRVTAFLKVPGMLVSIRKIGRVGAATEGGLSRRRCRSGS